MRATEITTPMLLLSEQERQVVSAQVSQGLSDHKQKSYASAAQCFTQAAKLGHPVAQYVLGVYYASGIGVTKNEHVAFQLYLEAARHGNTAAQRQTGECYLTGQGVAADLETGLAWLETAGQGGDAKACERLVQLYGSTKLQDGKKETFWRARLEELRPTRPGRDGTAEPTGRSAAMAMPPLGPQADLFQRRELYQNGGGRSGTAGITNGKFYYLSKDDNGRTKLCESELDGSGARVLADVEGYDGAYLAATSVSVFLYQTGMDDHGNTVLQVREVPLDNGMPREFCLEADDWTVRSVYVYCSSLFYVLKQKGMCCLCVFYAETATRRVLYRRASAITEVYAGADYVVFRARYENGDLVQEGWMRYDLHTGEVQSLDYAISPENVLDHPEYYDEDSRGYVRDADCRERDIAFFDLAREIMWQKEDDGSTVSLVAHSLREAGYPRCPEIPIWHMEQEWWSRLYGRTVYFDGDRMYCAPHYASFYSCGRDGSVYQWDFQNNGHGCCEDFCVVGDLLLLDGDAHGEKVYPAGVQPARPLGESWRKRAPACEPEVPRMQPRPVPSAPAAPADLETVKTLTATDVKYGILTFGAKFHVGFGVPVTVEVNGTEYSAKTHGSTKGRVDGVKRMLAEQGLREGDVVCACYDARAQVIRLDPIRAE